MVPGTSASQPTVVARLEAPTSSGLVAVELVDEIEDERAHLVGEHTVGRRAARSR